MSSNRSNLTTFSAHAKRKNNAGSKKQSQGRPGLKNGRKGRFFVCNKFCHYARECPNRMDTPRYDDYHNKSRGNFNNNDKRNGRSNGKGKRNVGHQGNGRPSKKSRNFKDEESNVVNNKKQGYYLISALSTASLPDTLGNWLIDSGASRHFNEYKEALSNLIET